MLEALTYRHFGHSRTDPATYRPPEEVAEWLARDPLTVARTRLEALGVPAGSVTAADERAAGLVAEAVEQAKKAPPPDAGQALTDMWADGGSAWRT